MNLKELSFPLEIYWDLTPAPRESAPDFKKICDDIAGIKVFGLSLTDAGDTLSNSCVEILERLKKENISITLTVSRSVLNASTIGLLSHLKVNELLVDSSAEDDFLSLAEVVQWHKKGNMTMGISFNVGKENYPILPRVVSFCLDNDINHLVFPMQRLTARREPSYVTRGEREALSVKLQEMKTDGMKLTIHDPFLWKVFCPTAAFPGAGCQAANTMAYISPEAGVYPCPSMPIAIGDLKESTLKAVLSSDNKKRVRKGLLGPPGECLGCGELKLCFGGCRGRTFVLTGSLDRRDPACG